MTEQIEGLPSTTINIILSLFFYATTTIFYLNYLFLFLGINNWVTYVCKLRHLILFGDIRVKGAVHNFKKIILFVRYNIGNHVYFLSHDNNALLCVGQFHKVPENTLKFATLA